MIVHDCLIPIYLNMKIPDQTGLSVFLVKNAVNHVSWTVCITNGFGLDGEIRFRVGGTLVSERGVGRLCHRFGLNDERWGEW